MGSFYELGKLVLVGGLVLAVIGLVMMLTGKFLSLGRLPGDIFIQKGNYSFYFPLLSSIILSIILTVVLNLFFRK